MAQIIFYEKPGCINNTKQKTWLKAAGHEVEAVNLLQHSWSKETLKQFFGDKPIADCFNRTAPVIKSGELEPAGFSEADAMAKMIEEPILTKRPLILIDQKTFLQGFDKEIIHELISLTPKEGLEAVVKELEQTDLTTYPKLATDSSCDEAVEDPEADTGLLSLTPIIKLVEEMGLEVTYAFEDLVFVEHSAFLFQFLTNQKLALYFNKECPEDDARRLEQQVIASGVTKELTIMRKGRFSISQKEDEENLELLFFDED